MPFPIPLPRFFAPSSASVESVALQTRSCGKYIYIQTIGQKSILYEVKLCFLLSLLESLDQRNLDKNRASLCDHYLHPAVIYVQHATPKCLVLPTIKHLNQAHFKPRKYILIWGLHSVIVIRNMFKIPCRMNQLENPPNSIVQSRVSLKVSHTSPP